MRIVAVAISLVVMASCASGPGRKLNGADLVAMKKGGISESEIVKAIDGPDVVLTLTDDDVIRLVEAGFATESINAVLSRARDVSGGRHH